MRGQRRLVRSADLRAPASRLAAAAVASASAFLIARQTAAGGRLLSTAALAIGAVVVLLNLPAVAMPPLLILGGTVLPSRAFPLAAAGVRTDLFELVAFGAIAAWALRYVAGLLSRRYGRRTEFVEVDRPRSTFLVPLLVLMAAVVVGTVNGLVGGGNQQLVQGQAKTYLLYLLILPLSALTSTSEGRRDLERWVIRIVTAGAAWVVLAVALGIPVPPDGPTDLITLGLRESVARVRPALLPPLFLASLLAVGRITTQGVTLRRVAQLLLYAFVWAMSFNRSSWLALLIAGVGLVVLRPGERRPLRALKVGLASIAVVVVGFSLAASGTLGSSGQAVATRAASVLDPQVFREGSYEDRADEDEAALRTISRRPLLGVGLGQVYGARRPVYLPDRNITVFRERDYAHNTYLFLWLHLGALGIGAVVLFAIGVRRAVRRAREAIDEVDATRSMAAAMTVAGIAIQGVFQPFLLHRPSILAIALSIALCDIRDRTTASPSEAVDSEPRRLRTAA